jgi:outer membrane protein
MQMSRFSLNHVIAITSLLLGSVSAVEAQSQPTLTLPNAVAVALEKNPARKMALAETQIAGAQVNFSKSSFFPRINFTETATVGDDPVYAFGTRLRQARFTAADFALDSLNHPDPISNFSSRIGGQWTLFNSFANKFQLRSAKSMEDSAKKQLTRADQQVIFQVIESYYGIALANKQAALAEQTVKTARSVLDSSKARVEAGTSVESDALSAQVNLASRQQDLIQARSALDLSFTQLETALGARIAPGQQPAVTLTEQKFSTAPLEETETRALQQRPDLQATASQLDAQQNSVKAAKAAYGPRLDVFGSWQADNNSFAANGSSNWITGAELKIDLFAPDREARLSMEKATLSKMEAGRKMAEDSVRLDVRRAWFAHDAAGQMLEVSRSGVKQSEESLRIMRDRYETGLATITDLLRAEDADRTARTNYWQAVYRYIVSYAALQLASGDLSQQSPVVTQ